MRLFVETLRLRRDDVMARSLASLRPVLGGDRSAAVGRFGDRRLATVGPLDRSMADIALDTAQTVSDVFTAAGLSPFVVDRRLDGIVIGVTLDERADAISALSGQLAQPGWFVRWEDRGSSGIVPLGAGSRHRRVARARALTIFRSLLVGERATGDELGVVVCFWELGSSKQLELVGTRSHERFDPRSPSTVEIVDGRRFPGREAFPVSANLEQLAEPIDVVYTWVDGSDPAWLDAFQRTAAECGRQISEAALDPARYRSRDELRYALRSLWMYCGWVRNIYVVTAGQRPPWLLDHERITIVDHAEILPTTALPTFNSHAIEAALHRIDGLAEHFVYSNDDMFFARPLRPETFFTSNGLARVFQGGARVDGFEDEHTLAVDTAARRGRELLTERFGRSVSHKPIHSPYPLRRSVMEEIDREFGEAVTATIHSRFRAPSDLSVSASFGGHYAVATGRGVFGEIVSEYVHVESDRLRWHLDRIRLGADVETYCINETQDRAHDHVDRESQIGEFLNELLPVPAPWERR
jgi:hypothetical protein